ncbi:hypothetical protein ACULNC_11585 [Shigella flexneri]
MASSQFSRQPADSMNSWISTFVVSVLTTVDDVHHRNRHGVFAGVPFSSAMCSYSGIPLAAAAAGVSRRGAARIALAPNPDLFSVHQVNHDLVMPA